MSGWEGIVEARGGRGGDLGCGKEAREGGRVVGMWLGGWLVGR